VAIYTSQRKCNYRGARLIPMWFVKVRKRGEADVFPPPSQKLFNRRSMREPVYSLIWGTTALAGFIGGDLACPHQRGDRKDSSGGRSCTSLRTAIA
jgi:hypothetical protein